MMTMRNTAYFIDSLRAQARCAVAALLLAVSSVFSLSAQQHTLSIDPDDTVYFDIDHSRGSVQWQLSHDNATWNDLPGRTSDTIKYVPVQFPSWFRMKIQEGTCAPHYSETVKVTANAVVPTVTTRTPENIGASTALAGGDVTDDGGAPVTARGVVYGTSPGPNVNDDMHTTDGSGEGSFTSSLAGLTPSTTHYVRAYAINSEGTSYGEEVSFTTLGQATYWIGGEGPAGGIVFYDKGAYSDGWRYLEAAPAAWSGGADPWVDVDWGCYGTFIGGTSTDIGTGSENTAKILANGCAGPNTPAVIAGDAAIGGYTDWFLPSRDELHAVYHNLFNLGANFHSTFGFSTLTYACSSEIDDVGVWGVAFGTGSNVQHLKKITTIAVRPVRRF